MRGLAALWVLLAHCGVWGGVQVLRLPDPKLAVDVFMLLSGFLMMHNYRGLADAAGAEFRRRSLRFLVRRWFRLAPLYYLVLAALFLAGQPMLDGYQSLRDQNAEIWAANTIHDPARVVLDGRNFLWHVSFLFGLSPTWSFSTMLPDWSLSLEMQFYAAFPLLLLARRRLSLGWMGLGALALAILTQPLRRTFDEPSLLAFKLHIFVAGMLLSEVVSAKEPAGSPGQLRLLLAAILAGWEGRLLLPAVALIHLCTISADSAAARAIGTPLALVRRALGCRPARFLGDISYSVYLVHGPILSLLGAWILTTPALEGISKPGRVWLITLAVTLATLPIAALLFRLVERPGIELGRRLLSRKPATA